MVRDSGRHAARPHQNSCQNFLVLSALPCEDFFGLTSLSSCFGSWSAYAETRKAFSQTKMELHNVCPHLGPAQWLDSSSVGSLFVSGPFPVLVQAKVCALLHELEDCLSMLFTALS